MPQKSNNITHDSVSVSTKCLTEILYKKIIAKLFAIALAQKYCVMDSTSWTFSQAVRTLYTVHCTVYCTLYCILYTVYCVLCTVYCILYTVPCINCILYTVYCILYTLTLTLGQGIVVRYIHMYMHIYIYKYVYIRMYDHSILFHVRQLFCLTLCNNSDSDSDSG